MKKYYTRFMLLLALLAGCAAPPDVVSDEEDYIVIGLSQVGAESDWRIANSESMKAVFTEENGYELIFDDARQKQENQIIAIRNFIQQDVDYIVLMPIVEDGWDSVLQEAYDAGIPVILVDRDVSVSNPRLYTSHIGSNFYRESLIAMEWLENSLTETGRAADASFNIIHIQGTPGASAQVGRTAGLEQAIEKHDNWNLIAQENGDFTRPKTYEVMDGILSALPPEQKIDMVYCENDNEAFGAIQALEEHGYQIGVEKGVIVISFDATRNGLRACMEGKISFIVECNPLLGEMTEQTIQYLEHGESAARQQYIYERGYASEDITEELLKMREY